METTSLTEIYGFGSVEDMFTHFAIEACSGTLLFAEYDQQDYEGEAFVLFERDGVLWEVNAAHCSCYGLENQWEPTVCTPASLKMRNFYGLPRAKEFVARM